MGKGQALSRFKPQVCNATRPVISYTSIIAVVCKTPRKSGSEGGVRVFPGGVFTGNVSFFTRIPEDPKMPLDFFVLFSSVAGLFGSRGQGNHAAAKTFLDAFADYLPQQNRPALRGASSEIGGGNGPLVAL